MYKPNQHIAFSKRLDLFIFLWYLCFFISLACCFRAISSISIILIIVTGLIKNKLDTGSWINPRLKNAFLISCCLFYLLQATGLLFGPGLQENSKELVLKSGIIFIPFAICCNYYLDEITRNSLMKYFIWILAAALFYCLLAAVQNFYSHHRSDVFFYHKLVIPLKHHHAVQVSIIVFSAVVYLLEAVKRSAYVLNRKVDLLLLFYFTVCIILLSSKLIIAFTIVTFLYYLVNALRKRKKGRPIVLFTLFAATAMMAAVILTTNKVSQRFNEIISGDIALVQQKNFDPNVYFNGLQFRVLQLRFVKEILTENNAWLTGVSANAQKLLDKKYRDTNMFIGEPGSNEHGFIGYNTHNQFLESILQSGIIGLIFFCLIILSMIWLTLKRKDPELTFMATLLIAYCLNESVFENQYGIILFTFYPMFFYAGRSTDPLQDKNNSYLNLIKNNHFY
ncbi:MAG: hypothetical protein ABIO04_12375 [Ferruginibacter sp.]